MPCWGTRCLPLSSRRSSLQLAAAWPLSTSGHVTSATTAAMRHWITVERLDRRSTAPESYRAGRGGQLWLLRGPGERHQRTGGFARCGRRIGSGHTSGTSVGDGTSRLWHRVRGWTPVGEVGHRAVDRSLGIWTLRRILAGPARAVAKQTIARPRARAPSAIVPGPVMLSPGLMR